MKGKATNIFQILYYTAFLSICFCLLSINIVGGTLIGGVTGHVVGGVVGGTMVTEEIDETMCGIVDGQIYYTFTQNNGTTLLPTTPGLCSNEATVIGRTRNAETHAWTWRCLGETGLGPICNAKETRCGDEEIGGGVGYTNQEQCDGIGQAQCGNFKLCNSSTCQCQKVGVCGSASEKTYYSFGNNGATLSQTSPGLCEIGNTVTNRMRDSASHTWKWTCLSSEGRPSKQCSAEETRCGDGEIGGGVGYANQESCDGEGKAQCGWSETCNSATCQCQIFKPGVCGDAAYLGFNSDEQVTDAGLCALGSTPIGPVAGKGPRVWQCKGEDSLVQNADGSTSIVYGTIVDCESYPLGKIEKGRLQLEIPRESQRDIVSNDSILNSTNSKNSLRAILKLSNEWLWIGLLVVLFGVLVYIGFYLITSVGDSEKMKTGLRMLLYAILGFVIALLSWAAVSLVTSMF